MRAQATDFLQSSRFHVSLSDANLQQTVITQPGQKYGVTQAGFQTCSTPKASTEQVMYKEGQMLNPRKFPGLPSYDNVTLTRGAIRANSALWDWAKVVIFGTAEYRADVSIYHYHRTDVLTGSTSAVENLQTASNVKTYVLYEAFPVGLKPAQDLDANSAEVSVAEIEICYEHFDIVNPTT